MESVGQQLREARLRFGLSLEHVSSSTRINSKSLAAIEADELSGFTRFHYRSFARQFASAVHLEPESLNGSLTAALERIPEALVPGQAGTPARPKVASIKPERIRMARWVYSLALLLVMLVACSTFYSMWQNLRTRTASQSSALPVASARKITVVAASASPASATEPLPVAAPRKSPPPAKAESDPLAATEPNGEFHIQLSAIEKTWLSVVSDGKKVYSGTLNATETKTLEGRETARIRTGNAGGVQVTFNGRVIGLLGSEGQVRTVVFTKDGYEILESQAVITEAALQAQGE